MKNVIGLMLASTLTLSSASMQAQVGGGAQYSGVQQEVSTTSEQVLADYKTKLELIDGIEKQIAQKKKSKDSSINRMFVGATVFCIGTYLVGTLAGDSFGRSARELFGRLFIGLGAVSVVGETIYLTVQDGDLENFEKSLMQAKVAIQHKEQSMKLILDATKNID